MRMAVGWPGPKEKVALVGGCPDLLDPKEKVALPSVDRASPKGTLIVGATSKRGPAKETKFTILRTGDKPTISPVKASSPVKVSPVNVTTPSPLPVKVVTMPVTGVGPVEVSLTVSFRVPVKMPELDEAACCAKLGERVA